MKGSHITLGSKQFDIYSKRLEYLEKAFIKSKYSSKSFNFYPNENDWKIIKRYVPTINLYITNRCNNFCKICFSDSNPSDYSKNLSKKEIVNILRKVGRKKRIVLLGGEPTVREDLFEIIKTIKDSGNYPELYTNGLRLSNLDYVKKLKNLGVKRIYFSLDGFRREIYEKMNENDKVLALKMIALKNIEVVGIDTIISARIVKGLNVDQIKPMINICVSSAKKRGFIKGIHFYGATKYGRFSIENAELSTPELIRLIERATGNDVDLEYMIESKKLALNLYKMFSRFGICLNFGSGGLIGLYKAGSIKKLFPTKFLKRVNKDFENKKILKVVWESLKNNEIRKTIMKLFYGNDVLRAIGMNGIFIIGVGNVNSPMNHKEILVDAIGFESDGSGGTVPIVNAARYSFTEAT